MAYYSGVLKAVVDFALPPRCPICGTTVEDDHRFCMPCWQELDFLSEPWCNSCGRPFAFERSKGMQCMDCLEAPPVHDGVRAVVAYDDKSSLLPMRLKYGGRLGLAELIARHLTRYTDAVPKDALIIPVPLHRWRLWSRGFNQSVLIGRSLSALTGLKLQASALMRKKATPPLRAMTASQRRRAVKHAFAITAEGASLIKGQHIILIDDVFTTGSTVNACTHLLKKAGAKTVLVFCWARVLPNEEAI